MEIKESVLMRFAICNELFEGWAFDEMCRFSKKAGYEGVELAPFTLAPRITDLTPDRRAELRAQAADAGIEIIGLHWLLAGTDGLYLTSPDAGVRLRTADYIVRLAEATRDLGGSLMVFGSPKQRSLWLASPTSSSPRANSKVSKRSASARALSNGPGSDWSSVPGSTSCSATGKKP